MTKPIPALAIESISVFAMPPVAYVEFVAELGVPYLGIALRRMTANPHDYPEWSLADDAPLRREMVAALRANGVKIGAADGIFILPNNEAAGFAADLDAMAELGVPMVNVVSFDPGMARNIDQFGTLAELAAARGMRTAVEFVPGLGIADLAGAVALVRGVGRADFGVTVDAMHLYRSGGGAADVAATPPELIGHAQICDVPMISTFAEYGQEALDERLVPGEGELPLDAFLAALPPLPILGIEVPQLSLAKAGVGQRERLAPCVAATRDLLARVPA